MQAGEHNFKIENRTSHIQMKRSDIVFILVFIGLFLPFFVSHRMYELFLWFSTDWAFTASFIKFAVLATMGEMLGSRIRSGTYLPGGFPSTPGELRITSSSRALALLLHPAFLL